MKRFSFFLVLASLPFSVFAQPAVPPRLFVPADVPQPAMPRFSAAQELSLERIRGYYATQAQLLPPAVRPFVDAKMAKQIAKKEAEFDAKNARALAAIEQRLTVLSGYARSRCDDFRCGSAIGMTASGAKKAMESMCDIMSRTNRAVYSQLVAGNSC